MSREIKFRTWNGHQMTDRIAIGENGKPFQFLATIPSRTEERDWPLMQFTGLKDRNGVEIYEGDLLALMGVGEKVEVRWSDEEQGWMPKVLKGDTAFEIVGNIYENPDLIPSIRAQWEKV